MKSTGQIQITVERSSVGFIASVDGVDGSAGVGPCASKAVMSLLIELGKDYDTRESVGEAHWDRYWEVLETFYWEPEVNG